MGDLPIYIEEEKQGLDGALDGAPRSEESNTTIGSISAEKLRDSITALSGEFAAIIQDTREVGGFRLKEIQIQAGIDVKAGIVLVGSAGVKGSITLTFAEE